ncbi:MAG TPA: cytochrome-c peroxidase [Caldithrix abyssi]|uniref:Cytochrome-c peroxidase n=1 Tax=Caldithrix abyssi TaxID=187145 RepID=A0A7V4U3I2_CALAY|nr:cytochrome-c peroxidase [Caldithrix abyssi]
MKKLVLLIAPLILLYACGGGGEADKTEMKKKVLEQAKTFFKPLPDKMPGSENDTPERIALGEKLYFDNILSLDNKQSCNTCHVLDGKKAGVDNLPTSPGVKGQNGDRNSPTVLNAGFQFVQFWDGRAKDLKEQAKGPVLNSVEMAMPDSNAVVKKLKASAEYKDLFAKAFPNSKDPVTYDNMAEAIAAFERTLITRDRFDDFLKGDLKALSNDEAEGLDLFIKKACITCHTGELLGGNMYQKMGLIKPYSDTEDTGRHRVTGNDADKFMFKVPTMRNVALTAPYFHDGKVESLREAIKIMADIQLGQQLTNLEALKIEKFLNALTDKKLAEANKK